MGSWHTNGAHIYHPPGDGAPASSAPSPGGPSPCRVLTQPGRLLPQSGAAGPPAPLPVIVPRRTPAQRAVQPTPTPQLQSFDRTQKANPAFAHLRQPATPFESVERAGARIPPRVIAVALPMAEAALDVTRPPPSGDFGFRTQVPTPDRFYEARRAASPAHRQRWPSRASTVFSPLPTLRPVTRSATAEHLVPTDSPTASPLDTLVRPRSSSWPFWGPAAASVSLLITIIGVGLVLLIATQRNGQSWSPITSVKPTASPAVAPSVVPSAAPPAEKAVAKPSTVASSSTGSLRITGAQPGVRASVDKIDRGELPVLLSGLSPGDHSIRLYGAPRYEAREQTVAVAAGQQMHLLHDTLKVLSYSLTVDVSPPQATVMLVREGVIPWQKPVKQPWPSTTTIDPRYGWILRVAAAGFQTQTLHLQLRDTEPVMRRSVKLNRGQGDAPATESPPSTTPPRLTNTPSRSETTKQPASQRQARWWASTLPNRQPPTPPIAPPVAPVAAPPAPAPAAMGTLNINSLPPSRAVLDGRPLGMTPRIGVAVPAGRHTVTFVHAKYGQATVSVMVQPGQSAVASHRFPWRR